MIDLGYEILRKASRDLHLVIYSPTYLFLCGTVSLRHLPEQDSAHCCCSCCLLLGGPGPIQCQAQTHDLTQGFETRNKQPSPQGCNMATGNANKYTKHCKDLNTFLHKSFYSVAATCQTSTTAYKTSHKLPPEPEAHIPEHREAPRLQV